MNAQLTEYLADPHDGGALQLQVFEGDAQQVRAGVLLNPNTGRWYPIRDALPSLFIDDLREDDPQWIEKFRAPLEKLGCALPSQEATSGDLARILSERKARDEQAEDYDKMLAIKMLDYFERPTYRRVLQNQKSNLLLEAGCGTGRFTGLFSELAAEVVAVDMSRDSILRNITRWTGKTASTVHYIHADLTHLPLKDKIFDTVAHAGVYEHIPSRELRELFLQHAKRALKPNGVLLLSAYRYNGLTKFFEKEGEHAGGIPFFRFTEAELKSEVETSFEIKRFKENLGIYMSMVVGQPKA
jgi:SAM-dependent methyltransferase